MNQDQIMFEKLTVEDQKKVRGGDLLLPPKPEGGCIPILPSSN
jgi:hypothetical protein